MLDRKNITKLIVDFYISFFIIIIFLITTLLILYYLTPNNYKIIKFESEKFIFNGTMEYIIEPNSNITIENFNLTNKYIMFNKETNVLVQNFFKSQGILCLPNELLFIKFLSDVVILNSTDKPIKISIKFYKKL